MPAPPQGFSDPTGSDDQTLAEVLAAGAAGAVMDVAITVTPTNALDLGTTSAGLRALYSRAVTADSPASGAGIDLTLGASAAFAASGAAGGHMVLQPGAGDGAGAAGRVRIRQPGGVAGTDDLELFHDGTNAQIMPRSGGLTIGFAAAPATSWIDFAVSGGTLVEIAGGPNSIYGIADLRTQLGRSGARWSQLWTQNFVADATGVLFYGSSTDVGVAQPALVTQTYATASATHAARTVATVGAFTGGLVGFVDAAERDNLRTQINALIVDQQNTAQVLNQVIDDLQLLGLQANASLSVVVDKGFAAL